MAGPLPRASPLPLLGPAGGPASALAPIAACGAPPLPSHSAGVSCGEPAPAPPADPACRRPPATLIPEHPKCAAPVARWEPSRSGLPPNACRGGTGNPVAMGAEPGEVGTAGRERGAVGSVTAEGPEPSYSKSCSLLRLQGPNNLLLLPRPCLSANFQLSDLTGQSQSSHTPTLYLLLQ